MSVLTQPMKPWLTPQEVADYYQIPLHLVWRRIRQKAIRAKNVGTLRRPMYRISAQEVRRLDRQLEAA